MSSTADATIAALRSGHDELVAVVADLQSDALTGPYGLHRLGPVRRSSATWAVVPRSAWGR